MIYDSDEDETPGGSTTTTESTDTDNNDEGEDILGDVSEPDEDAQADASKRAGE